MNKVNVMSTPFYEFTCEPNLTSRILSKVKETEFIDNVGNSLSDYGIDWYDEELFVWFYECLKKIHVELNLSKQINIDIISCWANKTKKLETHHFHMHPNSLISGVFYPHDSDADIIFQTPNIWFEKFNHITLSEIYAYPNGNGSPHTHRYKPKAGNLILFPSYIPHRVAAVIKNNDRYSVAFNTFISGSLGNNVTTRLSLQSKKL